MGQLHMVSNVPGVSTFAPLPGMATTIDVPDDAFLVVTIQCVSYLTNKGAIGNVGFDATDPAGGHDRRRDAALASAASR
ncbi:MAG: hypothetical protein R3B06_02990 [Kofleriaceae bacterium]